MLAIAIPNIDVRLGLRLGLGLGLGLSLRLRARARARVYVIAIRHTDVGSIPSACQTHFKRTLLTCRSGKTGCLLSKEPSDGWKRMCVDKKRPWKNAAQRVC